MDQILVKKKKKEQLVKEIHSSSTTGSKNEFQSINGSIITQHISALQKKIMTQMLNST